jgi:hypothetical protein
MKRMTSTREKERHKGNGHNSRLRQRDEKLKGRKGQMIHIKDTLDYFSKWTASNIQ